jgi:phenylpropionate dioxygenase-like ring-hydroxylating dioxygenase large terminal subunit
VDPLTDDTTSPLVLSASRYPTGWFQVAWSDEVPPGTVQPLHYFGRDLVIWRGESGSVAVAPAHCPHLGAHLGVRGRVDGDEIVCPWHAWHWAPDGSNTCIPYSEQQPVKENVRLAPLRAVDWYGCVLVWHDLAGRPPLWQPPALDGLDGDDRYPFDAAMRTKWRVKAHPQLVMENGVDVAHVQYIHGGGEVPEIRAIDIEGHAWRTVVGVTYGAGKEATWLTPDGALEVVLHFDLWGVGLGMASWPPQLLGGRMITNPTPVDEEYIDLWWCMTTEREPGNASPSKAARRMIEHQRRTVEQDFFIWENMKVLTVPSFATEEARYYGAMRRWARQFYPELGNGDSDVDGPSAASGLS